jgi:DNA damage-binding protein 1
MDAPTQPQLSEPLMDRDLDAARAAFASGNVDASIEAHSQAKGGLVLNASEEHSTAGGAIKAIVFGGLDGILTAFAIMAGATGANLTPQALLAMGVSNVLADALAMGAGEFLSSRAYNSYVRTERDREAWELENYPRGEIMEMIDLFEQRGMAREDAEVVITRMAKYKEFFINLMMTEELSLPVHRDSHFT